MHETRLKSKLSKYYLCHTKNERVTANTGNAINIEVISLSKETRKKETGSSIAETSVRDRRKKYFPVSQ